MTSLYVDRKNVELKADGEALASIRSGQEVASEIARYFPATLELATLGTIFGTLVGVPAGVLAATRHGGLG